MRSNGRGKTLTINVPSLGATDFTDLLNINCPDLEK